MFAQATDSAGLLLVQGDFHYFAHTTLRDVEMTQTHLQCSRGVWICLTFCCVVLCVVLPLVPIILSSLMRNYVRAAEAEQQAAAGGWSQSCGLVRCRQ